MAVAVVASSCQKDLGGSPDSPVVPGAVPADFDWKTTRNVTVSVSTPVVEGATPPYAVIRIYSSPILSAENLAARGVAKSAMPFRSAFTLNAGTENLYVQTTLPDGTKSVKMVGAHGTVAVTGASMKAAAAPKMRLAANARVGSSMPDYPKMEAPDAASFDSKAVITAIESGKSYQLGASWAFYAAPEYLIPAGAEVAGKLDLNGGFSPYQAPILYVAGKLTLSSLNIGRAKLAVLPGGEVKIGTLKIQPSAADGAAVYVFADGKRFIDEVGTRDVVSAAEIAQPGSYSYLVVDQAMLDKSSVIAGYVKRGFVFQGNTYEELAEALGVDAATFAETMNTWNTYVEAKNDPDFGRTSFAQPLNTAPYYAIKVTAGVHHTMGGLVINTDTEVLKADGTAIAGLYAAGEVTGGVHGANRLGGNAVADFVVFGRIAGEEAAEYALGE